MLYLKYACMSRRVSHFEVLDAVDVPELIVEHCSCLYSRGGINMLERNFDYSKRILIIQRGKLGQTSNSTF